MTNRIYHLGMDQPSLYQIRVEGWITERWKDWFSGMEITREESTEARTISRLEGVIADQAALQGLLQKLYNLGFPLLTVQRQEKPMTDSIDTRPDAAAEQGALKSYRRRTSNSPEE